MCNIGLTVFVVMPMILLGISKFGDDMSPSFMGTDHYIYRNGGRIYLHKVGGGEPVVFLHAVGLSGWA